MPVSGIMNLSNRCPYIGELRVVMEEPPTTVLILRWRCLIRKRAGNGSPHQIFNLFLGCVDEAREWMAGAVGGLGHCWWEPSRAVCTTSSKPCPSVQAVLEEAKKQQLGPN